MSVELAGLSNRPLNKSELLFGEHIVLEIFSASEETAHHQQVLFAYTSNQFQWKPCKNVITKLFHDIHFLYYLSGLSEMIDFVAISMTGFLETTALNISGCCPLRWCTRKPPWDPPFNSNLFGSIHGNSLQHSWAANKQSFTSASPTRSSRNSKDFCPAPSEPR